MYWTSEKWTKERDARAELLFWSSNLLFFWSRHCGRRRSCLSSLFADYTTSSSHFSSGKVERAKGGRAWKSPHAKKARRGGEGEKWVWNFCRRVADVPPRETSPSGKERGETAVFAGYHFRNSWENGQLWVQWFLGGCGWRSVSSDWSMVFKTTINQS